MLSSSLSIINKSFYKSIYSSSSIFNHASTFKYTHQVNLSTTTMKYIGSIDQGTSSTRFILFNQEGFKIDSHQVEFKQIYNKNGWVEHDPIDIIETVKTCINQVMKKNKNIKLEAVGITNQRETTIVWDKFNGKPLYNAIVWLDTRNAALCDKLIEKHGSKDYFRDRVGLPISTYFSAMKLKWLLENVDEVKIAVNEDRAIFGTVDSWILWNLTCGLHMTDVSNASRTMLLNLKTGKWDESICNELSIPMKMLPEIKSSSEIYGNIVDGPLKDVPISSLIGDQQGALLGQLCFNPGQAKNTYGTGCFLLLNTGTKIVQSTKGSLTTVAFQLGKDAPILYALEGGVAIAGAAISWLKNQLELISNTSEVETLARQVEDTGGVYFVPAFSGLFAPYWRDDARGVIVGLTSYTKKAHIVRATLEAVCFQTLDVIEAMRQECSLDLSSIRVDGGMTVNPFLLQLQSDLLNMSVERTSNAEATALGAAIAAGLAVGVWKDTTDVVEHLTRNITITSFKPEMKCEKRESMVKGWHKAIERSLNWVDVEANNKL